MSWEGILGQEPAVAYLRRALASGRSSHAHLFCGPAGVGKRTTALALAKALLCHRPAGPSEPCGACRSCPTCSVSRR